LFHGLATFLETDNLAAVYELFGTFLDKYSCIVSTNKGALLSSFRTVGWKVLILGDRYCGKMNLRLSEHLHNRCLRLLVALIVLVGFLLTIFLRGSLASIDNSGNYWAITIQNGAFTDVAVIISIVFDTNVLLALSLALSILFFYKNYRKCSLIFLGGMAGTTLSLLISKMLVLSPRPANALITEMGYSFPSGHITSGIVFFGLLAYFAWHIWNSSRTRGVSAMLFLITLALVGFDRIYINVHWISDVLGGSLLGSFWLMFSILVLGCWEGERNCKLSSNTLTKEKEQVDPIN